MSQHLRSQLAIALAMLVFFSGCHPIQPFYFHEDGDLSHYLDTATEIEYPDVELASQPDALETAEPLHLRNLEIKNHWDLTLEEVVAISLHNSEVIRSAAQFQQFGFASSGASRTLSSPTIYDPAIQETLTTVTPLIVDGNGNRVLPRGAVRAATIGGVADVLADFDAQLFSSTTWAHTDRPRNVGPNNPFNPVIANAHDGNFLLALSKRAATGGVFSARHTIGYNRNNTPIGVGRAVPSDWTAAFELEVNHPLFRNAGAQITRLPIVLARVRTSQTLDDFEAAVRNLVFDVERTYWDLHCAYRIVEANKQGRNAALAAWRKDYARAGLKDPGAQEPRSAGQYFRFETRAEASLASTLQGEGLLVLERRLRGLMGLEPTDTRLIRPVDEPSTAFVTFDWKEILLESMYRSAELRRQKWDIKRAELELISARNQLLPEVNLGMRYRMVGVGDHLIAARGGGNFEDSTMQEGSNAFANLTNGNFTEASLSLTVQPAGIGLRREHARISNAQLELVKSKKILEEAERNVRHELSESYSAVNNHYEHAIRAYSTWVNAEKEVRLLQVRREVDERLHDQLLDAFDRRANARIEFHTQLCEFNKAVARVHFAKGTLLEYNGIQLAEGPWAKKAYWDALGRARERDASYYLDYGATRPKVISRGPAPSGMSPVDLGPGASQAPMAAGEEVPTPAPLPDADAEELPAPNGDAPNGVGPAARLPGLEGPQRVSGPAAAAVRPAGFQWGGLGLDQ